MATNPEGHSAQVAGSLHEPHVALIVPTYNAAPYWSALVDGIQSQSLAPRQIIVIDSSSIDGTAQAARDAGFTVIEIASHDFNHGGTRQLASQYAPDAEILLYLTQDAIPCDRDSFSSLVAAFHDREVGAAYGRQVPRKLAGSIEVHARLFNYPEAAHVRDWGSRSTQGFKSIFFSNSFGAYRREALMSVGGFSSDVIFGEDTLAIARMHQAGWKTVYAARALVEHSHAYTIAEEFRRYFDIGVLHAREQWLLNQFGNTSGEGKRFVLSEFRYLLEHDPLQVPFAFARTVAKYVAYKLGRNEHRLPKEIKGRLSMNRSYWDTPGVGSQTTMSYGTVKKKVAP
jgi:rhamnosyltransferase